MHAPGAVTPIADLAIARHIGGEDRAERTGRGDGSGKPTLVEGSNSAHYSTTRPHAPSIYRRNTSSFLISAIALAGLRFFGQVRVQFMIVWQR